MKNLGKAFVLIAALFCGMFCGCGSGNADGTSAEAFTNKVTGTLSLSYAEQFSVSYLEGGYTQIQIAGENTYLLIPEGKDIPKGAEDTCVCIRENPGNVYVAGSATMDFFRELSALEAVTMTGITESDWAIPEIADRMAAGDLYYIGKYNAPDYEALLELGCELAVENTMIYHSPEVKEKIEKLGIPVLVDYSSYEDNPLGRLEWIKLYGVLTGHLEEAEAFFDENVARVEAIMNQEEQAQDESPTVAFFYISANGYAVVRRPGDYLSKMISMAGGSYIIPEDAGETDSSGATMNMQMESFYQYASEADIIIYNSTIDGEIFTCEELVAKNPLLGDFKAVKEGNAFCTNSNLFQQTTGICDMILDFYRVINHPDVKDEELQFLHRLSK